jgi:hypothetical protein
MLILDVFNVIILNNIVFNLGMQTWHFNHFLLIKFFEINKG